MIDYEKKQRLIALRDSMKEYGYADGIEELESIFPELRESEDERIREVIYKLLLGMRSEIFTSQDEIVTKEKTLAWLEKQKENPKSANSIPSDCASDAKCEDRWHKVQDFLPDNGRLVLAQDNLGNRLLARYDGEGNWEVSVYDNEDYYCRNTITKWCEIPSEQKEQKPQMELVYRMNGLMQDYIKDTKDPEEQEHRLKCYELFWEALEDADYFKQKDDDIRSEVYGSLNPPPKIPEQKPAEWSEDDEKIIQSLIREIDKYVFFAGIEANKIVNFLKSLRPSWKPSEEQMDSLYDITEPHSFTD